MNRISLAGDTLEITYHEDGITIKEKRLTFKNTQSMPLLSNYFPTADGHIVTVDLYGGGVKIVWPDWISVTGTAGQIISGSDGQGGSLQTDTSMIMKPTSSSIEGYVQIKVDCKDSTPPASAISGEISFELTDLATNRPVTTDPIVKRITVSREAADPTETKPNSLEISTTNIDFSKHGLVNGPLPLSSLAMCSAYPAWRDVEGTEFDEALRLTSITYGVGVRNRYSVFTLPFYRVKRIYSRSGNMEVTGRAFLFQEESVQDGSSFRTILRAYQSISAGFNLASGITLSEAESVNNAWSRALMITISPAYQNSFAVDGEYTLSDLLEVLDLEVEYYD